MARLLVANSGGSIIDHPHFTMAARSAFDFVQVDQADLIPLPQGSTLFSMPGARPVGWEGERLRWLAEMDGEAVTAVAAFLPSGYTRTLLPGTLYDTPPERYLPLWSYTAVGMDEDGGMVAAAVRSDALSDRFDPCEYDDGPLPGIIRDRCSEDPENRLLRHLSRCALEYHCFAAKNLFFGRWEAPLPTSPGCNARCLGCLSLQPHDACAASHERIGFVPSPEELARVAVPHLEKAEDAVVSFGQGCEGEPLTEAATLEKAVRAMREETGRGTIHLNTNGCSPRRIRSLARAGLNSVRISMNSTVPAVYASYHEPRGFSVMDVKESVRVSVQEGLFTAINLFVFPGITDREEELEQLVDLIRSSRFSMVQVRNMNIDPELYLSRIPLPQGRALGVRHLIRHLREEFPDRAVAAVAERYQAWSQTSYPARRRPAPGDRGS